MGAGTDEIHYRAARPGDAPAILAVVQAGFETYRAFAGAGWEPPDKLRPDNVERLERELPVPAAFARVAEVGGTLAGVVYLVPAESPSPDGSLPDLHLRFLFVHEQYWGSGIARTLHSQTLERIRGTARLYTPAAQARARRFYEREGWSLHEDTHFVAAIGLDLVEYRLTQPG